MCDLGNLDIPWDHLMTVRMFAMSMAIVSTENVQWDFLNLLHIYCFSRRPITHQIYYSFIFTVFEHIFNLACILYFLLLRNTTLTLEKAQETNRKSFYKINKTNAEIMREREIMRKDLKKAEGGLCIFATKIRTKYHPFQYKF